MAPARRWINRSARGHKKSALTPDRTLASLYIKAILAMLQFQNPNSTSLPLNGIFETSPNITTVLLLGLKSDPTALWPLVNTALEPLRHPVNYLRSWRTNTITPGPLTIVASGNADLEVAVQNTTYRDIFLDAH
jgi:hypothetical protein